MLHELLPAGAGAARPAGADAAPRLSPGRPRQLPRRARAARRAGPQRSGAADEVEEGLRLLDEALRQQPRALPGPGGDRCNARPREDGASRRTGRRSPPSTARCSTMTPTVVVALNHAVAVAMSRGLRGRPGPDRPAGRLSHARRLPALSRRARRPPAAPGSPPTRRARPTDRALALTTNRVEEAYLRGDAAALRWNHRSPTVDFCRFRPSYS